MLSSSKQKKKMFTNTLKQIKMTWNCQLYNLNVFYKVIIKDHLAYVQSKKIITKDYNVTCTAYLIKAMKLLQGILKTCVHTQTESSEDFVPAVAVS